MPEIYVLVIDSAKARILHATGKTSPLIETMVLDHPEGRMHTRDLTSDLPGRDSNGPGTGKHRMDSSVDPKQQASLDFAREIAHKLDDLVSHNEIDKLMIISAPALLGILRETLSTNVKNAVSFELDKNLANHSVGEIRGHIPYFKPVERLVS